MTAATAALALATVGLATAPSASAAPVTGAQAVDLVNPFIGSQEDGNTFPGATTPFGMVQVSPDTGHTVGYDYTNNEVRGFSQTHLSGVGCSLAGFVPIMPHFEHVANNNTRYDQAANRRGIVKVGGQKVESASAGHYSVELDSNNDRVAVDLTATPRTGIQRYNFTPAPIAQPHKSFVRVYAGNALNNGGVINSETHIDVANQTVRTRTTLNGFCQNTDVFTVWSTTKFNQPFVSYGTWTGATVNLGSTDAVPAAGLTGDAVRTGATLEFPQSTVVELQTAISYVSQAGADANLANDRVEYANNYTAGLAKARQLWADQLGKVKVTQGTSNYPTGQQETQLRVFYSALYRSFVAPNIGSDVDGKYRGWDGAVHDVSNEPDMDEYYQNYSLWDTYRTQQQWLYITEPERSKDMAKSLVLQSEQSGWLPRWGYGPVETNTMTGDPGTPFLVSAWDQGLLNDTGWAARAYNVLKHNADNVPPKDAFQNGRAGNVNYINTGFVPQSKAAKDRNTDYDLDHGGSATLEYALADGTLAYMAAGLGHADDAARYAQRSQNFRSQWNPDNKTFQARDPQGNFVDPTTDEGKSAFHEGTSPQYEWLVQQDIPSLIDLMGGVQATNDRLDTFFAYNDIQLNSNPGRVARNAGSNHDWWVTGTYDYYGTKTYNPNNEPDLHAPYVYLWTGQPWKTTDVVREALELFTDAPNGVTGNDDLGTMAAWQVMSTIGFYPILPGKNIWGLSTPVFDKVEIDLEQPFFNADKLTVTANGASMTNRYTQSVTSDGTPLPVAHLSGDALTSAGTLAFTVGTAPSTTWATGAAASPGALNGAADVPTRFVTSVPGSRIVVKPGAPAVTASVGVHVTGTSDVTGTLAVQPWSGITASITKVNGTSGATVVSASPRGGTVLGTAELSLSAAAGTKPGTYPLTLRIGSGATALTSTVNVVVPDVSPLAATGAFNNKAVGDRTGTWTARFNHTEPGSTASEGFIRDSLTAAGIPLGASLPHPSDPSLTYVLHDAGVGSGASAYDNITAQSQTTPLTGVFPGATKIAFIVSANNGSAVNQAVVLRFTDNTTKTVQVTATDWCSDQRQGDNIRVGRASERYAGSPQAAKCGLWATTPVTLDGKALKEITWPNAPKLHVFAIASDAGVKATGESQIGAPTDVVPGTELTATAPSFTTAGTATPTVSYQWLRDGVPIPGATGSSYTIQDEDAGAHISVAITGQVPGFAPQTVVSDPIAVGLITITTQAPATISGTPRVSSTLTVSPGAYSIDAAETYQWLAGGAPIPGATGSTLTLSTGEVGKTIAVRVTASHATASPLTYDTAAVGPVGDVTPPAVAVAARPKVTGRVQVGTTLRATQGSYTPAVTEKYQWHVAGAPINGATGATFVPRPGDLGKQLSLVVTASAPSHTAAVVTLDLGKVARGTIRMAKKPVIQRGKKTVKTKTKVRVGQKLKATKGKATATGAKVKVSYRWYVGKKAVKGKSGKRATFKVVKSAAKKKVRVKVTFEAPGYTTQNVWTKYTGKIRP
ncbi:hypothetical protein GCM10010401_03080 [Rarobacter faecitabidus]|uniref:GH92 family glycosyl hydrolase n=1 Tax=Rarobacter faecitabidus TaxID=13243 RepID=UPI001B85CE47|nr:GH92 family glycosyl hydrolase [Rarobacter faecitabidus]